MEALLEISNASSHGKIHNGYINLNGRFYSLHPILHSKDSTMQVPVQLRSRNYLFVFLYGQRGGAIKLKVKEATQEPTNHESLALDQAVGLDEDTSAAFTLSGSDQDGDPLTFRIVSTPAHGTLTGNAPALNYTPSADYNGSDTFTFTVNDGKVESKPAAVNLTIRPVNDAPIAAATVHIAVTPAKDAPAAAPISLAMAKVGEPVSLDGSPSTDVDGDQLTYLWTWVSYPAGLELALFNATEPLASFVPYLPGEYKARLVVNDGTVDSSPDDVTISVAYLPFSVTEQKLMNSNGAAGDRFGLSVSVDDHRAIVGAEGKETAHIYESNSPWAETAQLSAADGAAGDHFGSAVAVSGDYALVGAYGDDDSGSAYIFHLEGAQWTQAAKLVAGDRKASDFFGAAVALSGNYAVIGAFGDDTDDDVWLQFFGDNKYLSRASGMTWNSKLQEWENASGQFILEPNPAGGWPVNFRPLALRLTHTSPDAIKLLKVYALNRGFIVDLTKYPSGQTVPLPGDCDVKYIYAGYPSAITNIEFLVPATSGAPDAGSAYVFKREGAFWTQQAHLTAKDGAAGDAFGISVSISDEVIIVGAAGDDDKGPDSGSAYVFVQAGSAWVDETTKLVAEDGQAGDQFGASVAISGNIAVVGAPRAALGGSDLGAAYVFRYSAGNWNEEAKLIAGDGKAGDLFGASVSVSGDYVVIGAPGVDGSGALYVFKFDGATWNLEGKGVPKDAAGKQLFGGSVSIGGDLILSGAPGDSSQAGAAYAYSIDTYHTAGIWAEPQVIKEKGSSTISWSWVNAFAVLIEPPIGTSDADKNPIGSDSAVVEPDANTTYTITAYGPYGKDVASVTVVVESEP